MITLAHWEKRCYVEVSLGVSLLHEGAAAEGGLDQGGLPFSFSPPLPPSYCSPYCNRQGWLSDVRSEWYIYLSYCWRPV